MRQCNLPQSSPLRIPVLSVFVLLLFAPVSLLAACLPQPLVPVWWSPAKHATDISPNAVIYVVPATEQSLIVTLDGVPLSPQDSSNIGSITYDPGPLTPQTTYELVFEVAPIDGVGSTTKKIKSSFTTGDSAENERGEPHFEIVGATTNSNNEDLTDECLSVFQAQSCIDTGGYTLFQIETAGTPEGYAVRHNVNGEPGDWLFWPASCKPSLHFFGEVNEETCVEVMPLFTEGVGAKATLTCPLSADTATPEASGCRQLSKTGNSASIWPWFLLFLCLLATCPRLSKRHGPHRRMT